VRGKEAVMTREDITALFTRRAQSWERHDAAALAADHAPDCVVTSPTGGVLEGREDIERIYRVWFTAFPDLTLSRTDTLIEDHRAVLFFNLSGTHNGDFFGLHASGRHLDATCAFLYTLSDDGLIVQERRVLDFTGVLLQVGVLRAKPAAGA
jgi:steroid delta-isomerase-like uncharacterized protein